MKKTLAIFLCLVLLIGLLPSGAFAHEDPTIKSISIPAAKLLEGDDDPLYDLNCEITMSDGSNETLGFWELYDFGIYFSTDPEDLSSLAPGKHTVPVTFSQETEPDIKASLPLTVIENPVASIKVPDQEIIDQFDYYTERDADGEIIKRTTDLFYNGESDMVFTLKDGTKLHGIGQMERYIYDAYDIEKSFWPDCSEKTPSDHSTWKAGDVIPYRVSWCGLSSDFKVKVVASPIKELNLKQNTIAIPEGAYKHNYTVEETPIYSFDWLFYDHPELLTAIQSNGKALDLIEEVESSGNLPIRIEMSKNGKRYELDEWQDSHPFKAGDDVDLLVNCLGKECELTVKIEPTIVKSITNKTPIKIWEGDFIDSFINKAKWNIQFTDGSSASGLPEEIGKAFNRKAKSSWYYDSSFFDPECFVDFPGNDTTDLPIGKHDVTLAFLGQHSKISITVEKSTVKSISAKPITIREKLDGYYDKNSKTWTYNINDFAVFHVVFQNGTVFDGTSEEFYEKYGHSFNDDSIFEQDVHPWGPGTYEVSVRLSTIETTLTVTITPYAGSDFSDVPAKAFYAEAVDWAVACRITNGTSKTTFSPNDTCTRGQVVTFLWRANGGLLPKNEKTAFTDVSGKAFYADAVAWAVEKNVTSGTSPTTFSPNAGCTRGQVVTFLWRAEGCPEPSNKSNPFKDVNKSAFYYKAVLWAVEKNITKGMTNTTFCPNDTCTRGQIVTFLYRAMS